MDERTRARGVLLGLACGDALGRPVEFSSPEAIERRHGRVTEMLADGTHGQPAGTITDDTEMALCIARSLAENGEFDPADIAERFVEWKRSGPFDIGIMTSSALRRIENGEPWDEAGHNEWEASREGSNAGNGSLMRCAPYAVAYRNDPETRGTVSRESSAITHADPRCQWGCVLFNDVLAEQLGGNDRPLETALDTLGDNLPEEIETAATEVVAYRDGETDSVGLQNSGYVVTTLQAGLYHALTTTSAEAAIVDAVMMGGDTDTIAAVTGALAGARFGVEALPERWLSELAIRDELESLADELFETDHEQA
ncbi:ADP-ribosylglycohydrolase family protein [Natronomonas halophila]|uniref:ADP-ribosylglycohydrolase family protein n=1 Tax=Natronomonas halophila TaxID=2747817 RepID=UPI0015B613A0|nr:ADP-ribosylglycohydrolase family protein [Natronomonas halophila]QLD86040.1 ADP-ribosylglycohydrolase family protein [Natronomonas halophila]